MELDCFQTATTNTGENQMFEDDFVTWVLRAIAILLRLAITIGILCGIAYCITLAVKAAL